MDVMPLSLRAITSLGFDCRIVASTTSGAPWEINWVVAAESA